MINTHKLEILLSQTYVYDSKGVRAIEVLLYWEYSFIEYSYHHIKAHFLQFDR